MSEIEYSKSLDPEVENEGKLLEIRVSSRVPSRYWVSPPKPTPAVRSEWNVYSNPFVPRTDSIYTGANTYDYTFAAGEPISIGSGAFFATAEPNRRHKPLAIRITYNYTPLGIPIVLAISAREPITLAWKRG